MHTLSHNSDPTSIPSLVLATVLLVSIPVFAFGYALAVMHRARKDYRATKAALPGLRKGFWSAWLTAARILAVIAVIGFILITWSVRDFKDDIRDRRPSSVTPSRR